MIITNFKTYENATGEKALALAKIHQKVAHKYPRITIGVAVQKARAAGVGAIQGREQSLLTLVDQLGKSAELGKAPTRMQPEGDTEVKVWFEDVPFDALVRWMNTLESRYGMQISAAELERRAGAGLVNARLTVTRP